jgi:hypothetical protein
MHNWLRRNVSLLAFLLLLGFLGYAALLYVPLLGRILADPGSADLWQLSMVGSVGLMYLLGLVVAYGLLLRFLAFFDDVAAIRRAYTKSSSNLD